MTVQLSRIALDLPESSPGSTPDERYRLWAQRHAEQAIQCDGRAPALILLPYADHADQLDLTDLLREDPSSDPGATFRHLSGLSAGRIYLLLPGEGRSQTDGSPVHFAMLLEEVNDPGTGRRRWWAAMRRFEVRTESGVGVLTGEWESSRGSTTNPADLPPFLHPFVHGPVGAEPAKVLPPGPTSVDIKMTFGELPAHVEPPMDAAAMARLTRALGEKPLLERALKGMLVVKQMGRAWELYALSGPMPADPQTMIRYLANVQEPVAEGVGVISIAVDPDKGSDPGIQIVAQKAGEFTETWMDLQFPEGREGPIIPADQMRVRTPGPIPPGAEWLGVVPEVDWTLPMLGVAQA